MKTVVITGAGRGLGFALARLHAEKGDRVFAATRTLTEQLGALKRDFPGVAAVRMDVADGGSVRAAAREILAGAAHIDILYNNAGICRNEYEAPFLSVDFDTCLDHLNTNSLGHLRVTQALFPALGAGTMVCCVSSGGGSVQTVWDPFSGGENYERGGEGDHFANFPYFVSKAGMNMGVALLRHELEPLGAEVIAVHPGWMQTDMGGPKALTPLRDAAEGIFAIANREKKTPGGFVNYKGEPLRW